MSGCVRCRDLRAALDAGDDARLLELLEDLYDDETGAANVPPDRSWPRSGAGPTTVERSTARPPHTGRAA